MRSRTALIVIPALLVLALLPLGVGGYVLGLLTLAYYYAVFAMSESDSNRLTNRSV